MFSKADVYDPITYESDVIDYQVDIFQSVQKDNEELRRSGKLLELGRHIECQVVADRYKRKVVAALRKLVSPISPNVKEEMRYGGLVFIKR